MPTVESETWIEWKLPVWTQPERKEVCPLGEVLVTWGATTPIAPYRFPAIMKWPRDRKSVFVVKGKVMSGSLSSISLYTNVRENRVYNSLYLLLNCVC